MAEGRVRRPQSERALAWGEAPYARKVRRNTRIRRAQADVGEVVYYARRNGAVKIGFTSNLVARMQVLGVPMSDVLAIEPGGWHHEQSTHERFAECCVGGEYFRLGPDLLDHINGLRAKVNMAPIGAA